LTKSSESEREIERAGKREREREREREKEIVAHIYGMKCQVACNMQLKSHRQRAFN